MKSCKYEKKYRDGLKRCLRDGSVRRYCPTVCCPHFKASLYLRAKEKLTDWLYEIRR